MEQITAETEGDRKVTVSANKKQTLYVLTRDYFWWLPTLSTNRRDCWSYAEKYETKKNLQRKGYKCVAVRLEEVP